MALAVGGLGAAPGAVLARDAELVAAHRSLYPLTEQAAGAASGPDAVQAAYDAARDLQEASRRAAPVSAACRPLLSSLARYASGRVRQMEGIDRPRASDMAGGRRTAERARDQTASSAPACAGRGGPARPARIVTSPASGEVFFGAIVSRAPTGADGAALFAGATPVQAVRVRAGRARFKVTGRPGQYDLRITFRRGARVIGGTQIAGAWLLPASARRAVPGSRFSPARTAALARALADGPAFRAAWVQDLASGEVASVNGSAIFPAASTVKLGLLAGALRRLGAQPESSPYGYDLRAMATWSSNLASNRLLDRLGGVGVASDGLRRLGAFSSTYTGRYIVGTELQPVLPGSGAGAEPPRVSARVTTPEDLARMLFAFHAAAVGAPGARGETGLSAHHARMALGWLLSSQQAGENVSLLAGGAASGLPIAQKNGWIGSARHGAGIVYGPRGPAIVVLMTYDDGGVSVPQAQALGTRVAALVPR